jgi:zinc transport system permease protein
VIDDFLVRALLAGLGVAVVAGPFGCFVVWRRMSYFGESIAHSALLGVALGLVLGVDALAGIVLTALAAALLLGLAERQKALAADTLLGIVASLSLALGLIVVSFDSTVRVDVMAFLFGDILAVRPVDLAAIWGGGAATVGLLAWFWRPLVSATVHADLARVEGVRVGAMNMLVLLLLALVIAVSVRVVGLLLVIALLVIPAAAARRLAPTPEAMAALASAIGALAVAGGLFASFRWDVPAGPAIVVAAGLVFALVLALPLGRRG